MTAWGEALVVLHILVTGVVVESPQATPQLSPARECGVTERQEAFESPQATAQLRAGRESGGRRRAGVARPRTHMRARRRRRRASPASKRCASRGVCLC